MPISSVGLVPMFTYKSDHLFLVFLLLLLTQGNNFLRSFVPNLYTLRPLHHAFYCVLAIV